MERKLCQMLSQQTAAYQETFREALLPRRSNLRATVISSSIKLPKLCCKSCRALHMTYFGITLFEVSCHFCDALRGKWRWWGARTCFAVSIKAKSRDRIRTFLPCSLSLAQGESGADSQITPMLYKQFFLLQKGSGDPLWVSPIWIKGEDALHLWPVFIVEFHLKPCGWLCVAQDILLGSEFLAVFCLQVLQPLTAKAPEPPWCSPCLLLLLNTLCPSSFS